MIPFSIHATSLAPSREGEQKKKPRKRTPLSLSLTGTGMTALGLYAGLRREEILALKWECVVLDTDAPYLKVRRAWHTESNRPVIMTELKTPAARRDIAIPNCLANCLREAKEKSISDFVIANSDGERGLSLSLGRNA